MRAKTQRLTMPRRRKRPILIGTIILLFIVGIVNVLCPWPRNVFVSEHQWSGLNITPEAYAKVREDPIYHLRRDCPLLPDDRKLLNPWTSPSWREAVKRVSPAKMYRGLFGTTFMDEKGIPLRREPKPCDNCAKH
jgi:hypothetical protein